MHPRVLSKAGWSTVRQLAAAGITDGWTLAGGTALALQIGHRYSEDLDFFRTGSFDVGRLLARTAEVDEVRVLSRTGDTLHVLLAGLRISFFEAEAPLLFPASEYRGLSLADPRDIAAMKVIAIGGRGSRKDFIDLYSLLKGGMNLPEILLLVERRFANIDHNTYHLQKSLVWFDDAEAEPMPHMIRDIEWPSVRREIEAAVKAISV
ncbi:MAG: nucleotidyl transferase AbiEii/AbiGii toxin family protein [Gammaproteobacteria bacterium]|nr:nucleotidyl transferase AbiEii/AbiGii toxin family protein [Gammaproteobacteria bacterium]